MFAFRNLANEPKDGVRASHCIWVTSIWVTSIWVTSIFTVILCSCVCMYVCMYVYMYVCMYFFKLTLFHSMFHYKKAILHARVCLYLTCAICFYICTTDCLLRNTDLVLMHAYSCLMCRSVLCVLQSVKVYRIHKHLKPFCVIVG